MVERTFLISEEDEKYVIRAALSAMHNGLLGDIVNGEKVEDYKLGLEMKVTETGEISTIIQLLPKMTGKTITIRYE